MTRAATQTRPMVLILPGPTGAGKDTQAWMRAQRFGLVQLSTGDLRRAAVASGTEAGRRARAVMPAGGLASDEIVLAIPKDRLASSDSARGVIRDGFPRTDAQARALEALLAEAGQSVSAAVSLDVDDAEMVRRVSGRYSCSSCSEGYHDHVKQPAVAGTCDICGGTAVTRRAVDHAETVEARLRACHEQTAPLIAYHAGKDLLRSVDGMSDIPVLAQALAGIVARAAA
jgi:adenylate kinase